ncbi:MAG: tRNA (adenosine(37)-N6)-threonylcarbamoyltransferase complex ATPase subunit type 1 TsaE [Spirochaetia bacterium]|jgi:tRNA threonylcarbamoyladenosine biosynthesis protein TsaE|nr:tRNA (adenosine(37)-N6)-threonylcarbamoyltransferase complex ATPase subunit type 1 TsaE [Spirochaetia bacterium]
MSVFISNSANETEKLGEKIGDKCTQGLVISLRGSLGAGKTVIAKGIARSLGISEAIVSPTFTLVQEYEGRLPLYHMDLYRLSGDDEFEMIGGEEMLYSKGVTLVEWSEKIDDLLPENTVFVTLEIQSDQSRKIEIRGLEL